MSKPDVIRPLRQAPRDRGGIASEQSSPSASATASTTASATDFTANDLLNRPPSPGHTVQLYEDETFLTTAVAEFLTDGLTAGQSAIAIATAAHNDEFLTGIASTGLDAGAACRAGRLTLLDAREILSVCTDHGALDEDALRATVSAAIEQSADACPGNSVRLYCEMVDLLWKDGSTGDAVRMEQLWNEMLDRYDFSLLCGYALGNFCRYADAAVFQEICSQHSHVIPAESYAQADGDARAVEVSRLQQRARALDAEIALREDLEHQLSVAAIAHRRTEDALRQRKRDLKAALAEREDLLERERLARTDAERARERAEEANSAKSEFLAAMSHELRTPLNAIAGYVQLVELGIHGPVTDEQRNALARVQRSQQHLLSLINDILNFAKLEAGRVEYRMEEVPVAQVVADVACLVEPQLSAKGLTYTVRATPHIVRADPEKLQQILLNLISNAVKFTDSGGRVTVETAGREGAPLDVVFLRVSDTGCGIPRDKHDVIFDPFVQVSARLTSTREGTGLGLAICRDLARGMGGDIRVRSVEGKGSAFTVSLPAARRRSRPHS